MECRGGATRGQVDIPLSDVGLALAALGRRLQDVRIDRAVASPWRATRTAQLALGEARVPMLGFDAGLLEIAHGEWEGLLASEIAQRDPLRLQAWRMPRVGADAGWRSLQMVLDRAWP